MSKMGSTHDYTANFSNWESWIDITVLNKIVLMDQQYELSLVVAKDSERKIIDFII